MKIRTYKSHMRRALKWYAEQLYEKHMNQHLTLARVELMKQDLLLLQEAMKARESNSVWHVPVEIYIDHSTNNFSVIVADEANVLYLDFDQP